jgi:LPS sulfotransferase NodH
LSLDEFLQLGWSDATPAQSPYRVAIEQLRASLDLPEWWRQLNYVDIFTNNRFATFTRKFLARSPRPLSNKNTSSNRGYEHYRGQGLITDSTHELLVQSQRYQNYQLLLDQPHEHDLANFVSGKTNLLLDRWRRSPEPTLYVILFQGRAGSTWLTEHMRDHPEIHAFAEEFDTFPQTWVNQKRWLRNFYIRLPRKDLSIRVLGFKTKLSSVADPIRFKEFLEQKQIKVIHLERTNPVKLAISIVRADRLRKKCGESNLYDRLQELGKIHISLEEFGQALSRNQRYQELRQFVSSVDAPKLRLEYEQMLNDEAGSLKQVWRFLGVGPAKTSATVQKNTPDELENAVLNLDELRAAFPELDAHF